MQVYQEKENIKSWISFEDSVQTKAMILTRNMLYTAWYACSSLPIDAPDRSYFPSGR